MTEPLEAVARAKAALRAEFLARRRALSPDDCDRASAAIHLRLAVLPEFEQAGAVLTYVASRDNEVDTLPIIARLLDRRRPVFVPKVVAAGAMAWSPLERLDMLAPGRFGILEPPDAPGEHDAVPPDSVCLVPGIAFSPDGFRIGYGGGYFDRFLAAYPGTTIGLAFDCQIAPNVPHAGHDCAVHRVLTESTLYQPGRLQL